MSKMIWYVDRIRKMPVAEYFYRLNQIRKVLADKTNSRRGRLKIPSWDDERINMVTQDISGIERCFPDIRSKAVEDAEKILKHRFNIFGVDADFGDPIDWHLDPKTGRSWPLDFWGDIDFRDGETVGGIKFAWELNRLNHFPRLAVAFALTKDARFKDEIFTELESWLAANPYPMGINWIMGIELAIRIVNLVYALRFLGNESLTDRQRKSVLAFVAVHVRHLERYPSKYSSAANHAIAEALGLYLAGLVFPGFPNAEKWRESGRTILIRQIERQIYPDGGSFEHSLPYLQFILDQVVIFSLMSREADSGVPKIVEERLKSSLDFLAHLIDRRGQFPLIGDGDDGFILKLWFGPHNNVLSLLNTGAVLFDKPEWISRDAGFDHKTGILLGCAAHAAWEKLKSKKRSLASPSRYFPDSGLAVMKNEGSPEVLFIGNSGALGAPPLGAHGHADALSFWLSVGGKPVFIDPGTYLFHGGGRWRNYFRSTASHNTIRVDDLDQAEIISDFMYNKFFRILDARFSATGDSVIWSAAHDGYGRLKDPVVHRREVSLDRSAGMIKIKDSLCCRGGHAVEGRFHFHPECSVAGKGNVFRVRRDNIVLEFRVDPMWKEHELVRGRPDPAAGWYSPAFNVLQECWSLVLKAKIEGETAFDHSIIIAGTVQEGEKDR